MFACEAGDVGGRTADFFYPLSITEVDTIAEGDEYSVEYISWQGEHRCLAVTEKFTTGALIFKEKITKKKLLALGLVLAGIAVYAMGL